MLKKVKVFLALGLVPAVLGAVLIHRHAGVLPLAAAGSGLLLAAIAAFLFRTRGDVEAIARAAAEREGALRARGEELQERLEVLSAEREISLIVNEELDLRTILERVLAVTCDAMGGHAELWMKVGERLVPTAARTGGETRFDLEERDDPRVRQCLEEGRVMVDAEEGRLHALAPLEADREIVGVLRITSLLEDSPEARERRSRRLARELPEFSKVLALALKTPDLYTRAVQDALTGLWTKRHFMTQIKNAMELSARYGDPLSLILVDVDHFKKVNDTHGHVKGDKVLKGVADVLRKKVRGGTAYRYGGEEMVVLLPKATVQEAAAAAERLRAGIENHAIAGVRVTASFGVAQYDASIEDPAALVEKADSMLYRAKEGGRNRVEAAEAPPPHTARQTTRSYTRSTP